MAIVPKNNKTINMKISEVIKKLQEIQEEHGDLDVITYYDPWYNGYDEPMTEYCIKINKDNKLYIGG